MEGAARSEFGGIIHFLGCESLSSGQRSYVSGCEASSINGSENPPKNAVLLVGVLRTFDWALPRPSHQQC